MKIREYPKTLMAYIETSTINGYSKEFVYKEVVYNKTSYDSFIQRWIIGRKCIIDEKKPSWSELKDNNFMKRIWYASPNWILVIVAYVLGIITKAVLP